MELLEQALDALHSRHVALTTRQHCVFVGHAAASLRLVHNGATRVEADTKKRTFATLPRPPPFVVQTDPRMFPKPVAAKPAPKRVAVAMALPSKAALPEFSVSRDTVGESLDNSYGMGGDESEEEANSEDLAFIDDEGADREESPHEHRALTQKRRRFVVEDSEDGSAEKESQTQSQADSADEEEAGAVGTMIVADTPTHSEA